MGCFKESLLIDRLHCNYYAFQCSLRGVSRPKLFEMAGRISAVTEAYEYMLAYEWDDEDEISFFLQFRDPLTIISDLWIDYRDDIGSDLSGIIWDALNNSDDRILVDYPRAKDAESLYDGIV